MNKLYCNEGCKKEFDLTQFKIGMEELNNNIERHYLECPECKTKYTSYYINDEIKELQAEIKRLTGKSLLKIKQKNRLTKLKKKAIFLNRQIKMKVENE